MKDLETPINERVSLGKSIGVIIPPYAKLIDDNTTNENAIHSALSKYLSKLNENVQSLCLRVENTLSKIEQTDGLAN